MDLVFQDQNKNNNTGKLMATYLSIKVWLQERYFVKMIREIKNYKELDELVFKSQEGTIFQTSFWYNNSTSTFCKLGYYENNTLIGAIIFEIGKNSFKGKLDSLAPYLGFILSNILSSKKRRKILTLLAEYIKSNYTNITFFVSPLSSNLKGLLVGGFDAKLYYTYIINLENNINIIFKNFSKNLKRNINKSLNDDCYVKQEKNVNNLIYLTKKTFSRQKSLIWFNLLEVEKCMTALIENGFASIFTAYNNENIPIASVGIVYNKYIAHYIVGGYNFNKKHVGATSLAMWYAIKFCYSKKINFFDLEGSNLSNIDQFFKQFGGDLRKYYQIVEYNNTIKNY